MMRSEREMLDDILAFAEKDERIRAVTLEGSRTNPNVPKDMFQDYDISFLVTEMDSFVQDPNWENESLCRLLRRWPCFLRTWAGVSLT